MAQPDALRLGSLCTGYGGLDMAAQQTFGGSLAWVADNDPGASRILAHRYQVPNLGDLTAIDWTTVASVDIVTGGYPCQPFSSMRQTEGNQGCPAHLARHRACPWGSTTPTRGL